MQGSDKTRCTLINNMSDAILVTSIIHLILQTASIKQLLS
ncbi:19590_t:CDS:2 [Cetraspora pellucida]|uniref:19590_t:CDS:1 n=1 Tax=Cetraspora pellucida TaxID=1433469 RepID=A0A9N9DY20_9GLOM|nr:19590_t:CDS:2 [Cetraspora pellucida]